jgi:acyl-[acyl carrier protein]--UDP-N-acetylglucosamine O-acyltransferase
MWKSAQGQQSTAAPTAPPRSTTARKSIIWFKSQVGIAGSTTTGDYVIIGGQAGLRDHVHIGTGARLGAMAGITNDVPDGVAMLGIPATPEREQKLKLAALAKLPEMRQEFKAFRRELSALQNAVGIQPKTRESEQAA